MSIPPIVGPPPRIDALVPTRRGLGGGLSPIRRRYRAGLLPGEMNCIYFCISLSERRYQAGDHSLQAIPGAVVIEGAPAMQQIYTFSL